MTHQAHARADLTASAVGALCGLAWAAALRAYMTELVTVSSVEWPGTFVGVLLPGVVTGALLGLAWARGTTGRTAHIGWFGLAPLSFAIAPFLTPGAIEALTEGLGGGAIAFAVFAVIGGFCLGGSGPLWARIVGGVLAAAFVVGLFLTPSLIRGPSLAITEPRGLWVALLVSALAVVLMIATAIPFRFRHRAQA